MEVKRAYKFRFYPTRGQVETLAKTFGCCRFVFNYMLRLRTDAWANERKSIDYHQTSALLTKLKKSPDHAWLKEVSSVPVQQSLRHLNVAFVNFFAKRGKYPRFKKRSEKQSVIYMDNGFKFENKRLTLGKMEGFLDVRWSREIPPKAKVSSVTISKDSSGRYFVSLLCDDTVEAKPEVSGQVGIDLGLTHFAILSTGEKVKSPNAFRKYEKRLATLQRRYSKKQKGSSNREKARLKVARIQAKISDTRRDFLHKLSTRLINENQVIALEDLSVDNMLKNRCLSKSISDQGWGEFVRQLEYKTDWYGRTLVKVNKWFPSTKRCSQCGHTLDKLPLSIREWTCPECGVLHDRDINAALNILAVGMAVTACGEDVRPTLVKTGMGNPL